jgi:UDP-N-acetylmuramate dehydrogenase
MEIKSEYSLFGHNAFAIDVKAKFYAAPSSTDELAGLLCIPEFKALKKLIIGGGSNMLFTRDFDGLVIHPEIKGKSILSTSGNDVVVRAGAGENWDELVQWAVDKSFGGIENLSSIPGDVGACPVQNIGAYGVEVGDLITGVETIEMNSGKIRVFSKEECKFAYRESVFKGELKERYIISSVLFKLSLVPRFNLNYGAIKEELAKFDEIKLSTVRQAIVNIRAAKLPDPTFIPNAGSFFKNPSITKAQADKLKLKFPGLVHFPNPDGSVKLAAAWMIDQLGWKGKSSHRAGVHDKQALVLVNKGNATGNDILELAAQIRESVLKEFGVELEYEVSVV